MRTIKTCLAFTVLFFTTCLLYGQKENLTFNDWDKNKDAMISRSEFVDIFTYHYVDDWNIKDDEHLDDEDFFVSSYGMWDTDNDEMLSEEEWLYGYDHYYGDYVVVDYLTVDEDGDGFIQYTEFYDIFDDTDYYTVWDVDADGYLNEFELARMVFNNWDIDNTNFIEVDEYQEFDSLYLDI